MHWIIKWRKQAAYICGRSFSLAHMNGGTTDEANDIQGVQILGIKIPVSACGSRQMILLGLQNSFSCSTLEWRKEGQVTVVVHGLACPYGNMRNRWIFPCKEWRADKWVLKITMDMKEKVLASQLFSSLFRGMTGWVGVNCLMMGDCVAIRVIFIAASQDFIFSWYSLKFLLDCHFTCSGVVPSG